MKKIYYLALALAVCLASCENAEPVELDGATDSATENTTENSVVTQEIEIEELEEIQSQFFSEVEDLDLQQLGNLDLEQIDLRNSEAPEKGEAGTERYRHRRRVTSLCLIKDADRCPFEDRQPFSNMWWPEDDEDYFNPTTFFKSSKYCRMIFATFSDGTALIRGVTTQVEGNCKVYLNVWMKDKKTYDEFTAIGGEFKLEPGCASQEANPEELKYYEIDSRKSWLYSWGSDCIGQGCFGLEQRGENLRGQLGPNGAGFDSNIGDNGFSNWGWITDRKTGERLWVMDFDFRLRCCPRYH